MGRLQAGAGAQEVQDWGGWGGDAGGQEQLGSTWGNPRQRVREWKRRT